MNKIFNIGLPKTGTHSLNVALNRLGFKSLHNPIPFRRQAFAGCYRFDPNDWRALTNFGEHIYAQLDANYPDSKFILTVRDKESWLDSYRRQIGATNGQDDAPRIITRRNWFRKRSWLEWARIRTGRQPEINGLHIRLDVFGTYAFVPERLTYVYDLHYRNVLEYFKGRPDRLLILDICDGEGWEKLCSFLNVRSIPSEAFPHKYLQQR